MVIIKKNAGLGYYVEQTVGTCPTLAGTDPLRFTRLVSEDLNASFSRDESNEVRGDAQTAGSVITGVSGNGSISIQYSMETYDELIAGLLFSYGAVAGTAYTNGWKGPDGFYTAAPGTDVLNAGADYSLTDDTLTLTSGQGVTLGATAGEYVQISGSGNAQFDGMWRLDVVSGDTITFETVDGGTVATYIGQSGTFSEVALKVSQVEGVAANGVQDRSFGFVRFYSDTELAGTTSTTGLATSDFAVFRGAYVTSMQLSVAPGQAGWTGSFSVLHAGEESGTDTTATASSSSFTMANWDDSSAPNTNPLPDAILGVANVKLRKIGTADGERIDPLSLNLTISNNASEVLALRNQGALAVIQGSTSASLDMEVIYEDSTLHASMSADDAYEIEIGITDSDGKGQLIRLPKCRLTSERPNPGKNAPIVQRLSFIAEPNGVDFEGGTTAKMVEVLRFYTPT